MTSTSAPLALPVTTASSGADVVLTWPHLGNDVHHYEVYRSPRPYFAPGDSDAEKRADVPGPFPGAEVSYTDHDIPGLSLTDHFYVVLAVAPDGSTYAVSNRAGRVNFALAPGDSGAATPTPTATATATAALSATATATGSPTPTSTPAPTATSTAAPSATPTAPSTPTPTPTPTATGSSAPTPSATPTPTVTTAAGKTPTPTRTLPPTRTPTPTSTPTSTLTPIPGTVIHWISNASGSWHQASNWDLGRVPGATDSVIIDVPGAITVTFSSGTTSIHDLQSQEALVIADGTLDIAAASVISNAFMMTAGTLTGSGDLMVRGPLTWTGGYMNGAGHTIAAGGLALSGSDAKMLTNRTLDNAGAATWRDRTILLCGNGVFNNLATATFDAQDDHDFTSAGCGYGIFNNAGVFRKSGGTGTTRFYAVVFNNTGTVNIETGTLSLTNGGTASGAFTGAAGSTIEFTGGTYALDPSSSVSVPNVVFSGSTANISGSYDVANNTSLSGTTNFTAGARVLNLGSRVTLSGGTTTIDTPVAAATFVFSGGTLTGTGDLVVNDFLQWTNGTMSGAGHTVINMEAVLGEAVVGGSSGAITLMDRTLDNFGTVNWAGSNIWVCNAAVIRNDGLFIAHTDNILGSYGYCHGGAFENTYQFIKQDTTGTTTLGLVFNNHSGVDVLSGTLRLPQGSNTLDGTFTGATGATLEFSGGTHTFGTNSWITIPNVKVTGGTVNFGGAYNVSDSTTVMAAGGSANFLPGAIVTNAGNLLTLGQGVLDTSMPLNLANVEFTGGTLSGSGDITITHVMTWTAGTLTGSGKATIADVLMLVGASGNGKYLDGRTLDNRGTTTWNGSTFGLANGAIFNNALGATFIAQNDGVMTRGYPIPTFNNAGAFRKVGGTGVTEFGQVIFNNSGTVEVLTGTLRLSGGGTASGSFTGAAGTTLEFASGNGSYILDANSRVDIPNVAVGQVGSVNINPGFAGFNPNTAILMDGYAEIKVDSPITVTTLDLQTGTLSGTGDITVTGVLTWAPPVTMSGPGRTISKGKLALVATGGNNILTLGDDREIVNEGTATWDDGLTISARHGTSFRNAATGSLDILGNGRFSWCDVPVGFFCQMILPQPTFVNEGTVTHSGSGVFDLSWIRNEELSSGSVFFTNRGTVDARAGTLAFEGYIQSVGMTRLSGSSIVAATPSGGLAGLDIQGGALAGTGTITGTVYNAGRVDVGGIGSAGKLLITNGTTVSYPFTPINGGYTQAANGVLGIELGGAAPGTQFDQLQVTGSAALGGTLDVQTINGYTPPGASTYTVLTYGSRSGAFATLNGNGETYTTTYGATNLGLTHP